jgi:hypothetical protein
MAACQPTLSGKHWSAHQDPINTNAIFLTGKAAKKIGIKL